MSDLVLVIEGLGVFEGRGVVLLLVKAPDIEDAGTQER
jgi:hypothetical protein